MNDEVIRHADGRVELRSHTSIEASRLYNDDLAPVPIAQRNWTTYNYAALWICMAHCIPTYMLASGLIGAGHELVAGARHDPRSATRSCSCRSCSTRIPGTKYGIPFPVFARAALRHRSARTSRR